jgi:uncharacterized protein (DUF885 family)
MRRLVMLVGAMLVASACSSTGSAPSSTVTLEPTSTTSSSTSSTTSTTLPDPGPDFDVFLEVSYEVLLLRSPQQLTSLGISAEYGLRNDRLDDLSFEFMQETQAIETQTLAQLRTFDRAGLTEDQQLSYDIYEWWLQHRVDGHRFLFHAYPVHHFGNSWNFNLLLFLTEEHPLASVEDAEDYIARIAQIDDQTGKVLERLAISERRGVYPTQYLVPWTINTLRGDLNGATRPEAVQPDRLELYTAFERRIADVEMDDDTRQDLLDRVEAEIEASFVPAWFALIEHMQYVEERAPAEAGVWRLPDGDAYYAWLLQDQTSTNLTADEIHQSGLREVERVQTEMRAAFTALGYPESDSLGTLRQRARDEVGSYSTRTDADVAVVLGVYDEMMAEAEQVLRPFFGLWPEGEVEVIADPQGGGYYVAGSVDGTRPGQYHVGIGGSLSRLTMATILYHETWPGHHLQIALAGELDLPTFRRYIHYNAFAEGWGLYAERLAWEAGLYDDDPYGNIGRLELELLRAVRLVVDSGLHSKQWTPAEARRYMDQNVPGWNWEVERYLVLPGQATGYMIGLLEMLEWRGSASVEELREFHNFVLSRGSVPLGVGG